jgi:molybdenum cofactor guanylyltransferase
VLAGGQAKRLGGVDKPRLRIGGHSLAAIVTHSAISAGATKLVLVGPPMGEVPLEALFTREDPPGGGPIPALRAGIALVGEPWVLLLAADLPFLTARQLRELLAAAPLGVEAIADDEDSPRRGAVLVDDQGKPQWLTSCWPTSDLRAALDEYKGSSLSGLLGGLPHELVTATVEPGQPPYWLDCDTPADLQAAERWASGRSR